MRARNIKPDFFRDAELSEVTIEARYLFIGLWCLADREGKLKDKPKQIRFEIFPETKTKDDIETLLNSLVEHNLIIRYEIENNKYIKVVNFLKHQSPHHTEMQSKIPDPPCVTVSYREPPEISLDIPLIPDSLIPDLLITDKKDMSPPKGGNGSYPSDFESIYFAYPKNQRGSKKNAFDQFKKVKSQIPKDIIAIIQRQTIEKQEADSMGIFYPEFQHLERWLKAYSWQKEPFDFKAAKPKEEQPKWVREVLKEQSGI